MAINLTITGTVRYNTSDGSLTFADNFLATYWRNRLGGIASSLSNGDTLQLWFTLENDTVARAIYPQTGAWSNSSFAVSAGASALRIINSGTDSGDAAIQTTARFKQLQVYRVPSGGSLALVETFMGATAVNNIGAGEFAFTDSDNAEAFVALVSQAIWSADRDLVSTMYFRDDSAPSALDTAFPGYGFDPVGWGAVAITSGSFSRVRLHPNDTSPQFLNSWNGTFRAVTEIIIHDASGEELFVADAPRVVVNAQTGVSRGRTSVAQGRSTNAGWAGNATFLRPGKGKASALKRVPYKNPFRK